MIRAAALSLIICCTALSCAEVKKAHQLRPLPNAIPVLHITNDSTATALTISLLNIKTVVAANIATTTFEVHFYNPNNKILEGEFEFPLADGQQVTRYALDMNGTLREGVVVEKSRARIAFESTVRKGIDPGLVEKTKGNNFRTRIYPLPAKGYRKIVIAVEQILEQEDKALFYQLPLYAKEPIDTFSMHVSVIGSEPQLDENGIPLQFVRKKNTYTAELNEKKFIADKTVAFSLPGSKKNDDLVLTETHDGQTYFYVNSRIEPQYQKKNKPASIGLFWDISSSGEKRDLAKEIELLKQYLSKLDNVSVSLVPFNVYTQPKEDFIISGGNADKLLKRIKSLVYDGGTQFGAIDLSKYSVDEFLLFSDGLSTFGKEEMVVGGSPVMAVTSSPSANYSYLKYIAQQTHGSFVDLGKLEIATALNELGGQSLQIINIKYKDSEIGELVTQTTLVLNTGFSFAGKLNTTTASIIVELGFSNDIKITKNYTIIKNEDNEYDAVKRAWASMTINRLDMEYEKNKEAITSLGKKFSIVTQNTSLIVLDRVEDYVEHEIVPPVELQKEYYVLLKQKQDEEKDLTKTAFTEAVKAMTNLKEWWRKDFTVQKTAAPPPLPPPPPVEMTRFTPPVVSTDEEAQVDTARTGDDLVVIPTAVPFMRLSDSAVAGEAFLSLDTTAGWGGGVGLTGTTGVTLNEPHFTYRATAMTYTTNGFALSYSTNTLGNANLEAGWFEEDKKSSATEPKIELSEWSSGADYLKTLEKTSPGERMNKYLSLKNEYSNQPSFFVDVARFFIEKNEKQPGIQILSNVSEMKLEDAELLRMVANQLLDAGEKELAIITFQQILKMREEDPQSYRDLALAYNETADYNKALEFLYKLVLGTWDERFGDVKAIALNEMNAIISAHSSTVSTAGIDKKFIYAMPVDVRIVIGWNADNSDIDLWVTDPLKEKCFYEHTETEIGGKISRDVIQGYGPEEFLLRKAKNGNYVVDVNLYGDHRQTLGGPIAIKADLFTDFGRPTQKRKTINLRVTTDKEVINLGSLKFGS